ncbi:hypothetical protein PMAYCL1PPCAC_14379, partial [Pristionchus mayeri]
IEVLEICLHATNRVCRRTSTASLIIPILSSTIMRVDAIIKKGKMKTESKLFTNYLLSELKRRRKTRVIVHVSSGFSICISPYSVHE